MGSEGDYLESALQKYSRYLFHELRNGFTPTIASTKAMWKTREEMLNEMKADPKFKDELDREEAWGHVLVPILIFRQLTVELMKKIKEEQVPLGDPKKEEHDTTHPSVPMEKPTFKTSEPKTGGGDATRSNT